MAQHQDLHKRTTIRSQCNTVREDEQSIGSRCNRQQLAASTSTWIKRITLFRNRFETALPCWSQNQTGSMSHSCSQTQPGDQSASTFVANPTTFLEIKPKCSLHTVSHPATPSSYTPPPTTTHHQHQAGQQRPQGARLANFHLPSSGPCCCQHVLHRSLLDPRSAN